jgi:hypothetical protein
VATRRSGHHGCIHDPQPLDATDAEVRRDDGVVVDAHPARPDRVVERLRAGAQVGPQCVVVDGVRAGEQLTRHVAGERLGCEDPPGEPQAGEQQTRVASFGVGEVPGIDLGRSERVCGREAHLPGARRLEEDRREGDAVLRGRHRPLLLEEHGREDQLQLRRVRRASRRTNPAASATLDVSGPRPTSA